MTTTERSATGRRPRPRPRPPRQPPRSDDRSGAPRRPPHRSTIPTDFTASGSLVDLWDSGWPTGRYYWTVVPVREVDNDRRGVQYFDAEVPQDACAAGRVLEFGKSSQPVDHLGAKPYVSGLTPSGELVTAQTATPSFYRAALIAWEPALGAIGYEVQWSQDAVPVEAGVDDTVLHRRDLDAARRARHRDSGSTASAASTRTCSGPIKQMSWSTPVRIRIATPRFLVQNGVTTRPVKK